MVNENARIGFLSAVLKSEVKNMLVAAYSYEEDIQVKQEEARQEGIERVNKLNSRLIQEGRIKDLERSANDKDFQK